MMVLYHTFATCSAAHASLVVLRGIYAVPVRFNILVAVTHTHDSWEEKEVHGRVV